MLNIDSDETPKKHILCYGDSNTWGYEPGSEDVRMPSNVRWPGVVSKLLRTSYRITEEGLCGRTTIWDDPSSPFIERNGLRMLGAVLDSHKPIDLVIVFLGTNDLKTRYSATATDIANGVELLARTASNADFGPGNGCAPDVLAVCPPSIWEVVDKYGAIFKGGREKSYEMRDAFRAMSKRTGVPLFYAEDFVASDTADGIHLSRQSHGVLGQEIAKWILEWNEVKEKGGADTLDSISE